MIFNMIFDFLIQLINWMLGLLPSVQYAINLDPYLSPVASAVSYLDTFVSLQLIIGCIGMIIIIDNFGIVLNILRFIWDLIPFT